MLRTKTTKACRLVLACAFAVALSACGVALRSGDSAAVGGGPAQATSQAQVMMRSTTTAFATITAGSQGDAVPCECETGK